MATHHHQHHQLLTIYRALLHPSASLEPPVPFDYNLFPLTWGVSLSTSSSSRLFSQLWKMVTFESVGRWTLTAISVLRCTGSCWRISFSRIIFLLMWRCWYQLSIRCRSSLLMWWLRRYAFTWKRKMKNLSHHCIFHSVSDIFMGKSVFWESSN